MVPLDVCHGDTVLDIEQCIPPDFTATYPSDTLLEVKTIPCPNIFYATLRTSLVV